MSDALYERYKDALRRGHVAALRNRLDAALLAYGEAADIAPERALPHASLGRILGRLDRQEEALAAYGRALERAPADEAALAGRADVLASMGRRMEAAEDLDHLAEVQDAAGHLVEACDTARRALELAESKARRRQVEALAGRLRESPGDEAAAAALERALGILEPIGRATGPSGTQPPSELVAAASPGGVDAADRTLDAEPATEPEPQVPLGDGAVLTAEAEELLDAGDGEAARDRLVAAARAHRATGRINAALDACYLALGIVPFDLEIHVLLTELYLEQGWRAPAAEKLLLLGRLVELAGDDDGRRQVCAMAGERFPDDERLAAMCA